jgi:hypothetical protein
MLFLRALLFVISFGFLCVAAVIILYDIYLAFELDRILRGAESAPKSEAPSAAAEDGSPPTATADQPLPPPRPVFHLPPRSTGPRRAIQWSIAARLLTITAFCSLAGKAILVVPDGYAAVRISQISGVHVGTLYPGAHLILPLIQHAQLFDIRDKVYSTAACANPRDKGLEVLTVEAREGLSVGLAVTVRYRLDPRHLDYVQATLPQPIDEQIVAPVVTSIFRDISPNYMVRDVFSTKRDEFHARATQAITARLAEDQIIVKEVLLRKVQLPEEYAQGLQGLLLK